MAEYRVTLASSAERELLKLPLSAQNRAEAAIDKLSVNPRPLGVVKLKGRLNLWRIRVGTYRVIYGIDDGSKVVDVTHIRHRKDAYR
ncbi:MAG: type II toxin-antitoxin system RelE/ParE family toxin [Nitrospirae bacterium]|nr:type II toxin-antitoxin system RelE/ParE family toxin [Nitrospirota bacterium]